MNLFIGHVFRAGLDFINILWKCLCSHLHRYLGDSTIVELGPLELRIV